MARPVLRIALAASLLLTWPAAAQDRVPVAPALKQNVIVTDELVRIGDLVENAGDAAEIAVFRSPDLGSTGYVPVAQVMQAVRAHDLFAIDTRGFTEISVTRASRPISTKDIEERIARAIAQGYRVGDPENLTLTLDRELPVLQAESGLRSELVIARLIFDPRSGRFNATLELPGSKAIRQGGLHVTGVATETQAVAVLRRAVPRGEILRASDIAIERRPKNDLAEDVLFDAQAAAGLSVRQQMRVGQVLRKSGLTKPEIVQRGQPVMLLFEAAGMKLTMRGTATENGTQGDIVNVTNLQSKRTVQGVVTGPGEVTVSTAAPAPRVTAQLSSTSYQPGTFRRKVQ